LVAEERDKVKIQTPDLLFPEVADLHLLLDLPDKAADILEFSQHLQLKLMLF
jgi:hypothetical protein